MSYLCYRFIDYERFVLIIVFVNSDDVFEAKKVLIFGNFDSFEMKSKDLKALKDKVSGEEIWLTVV